MHDAASGGVPAPSTRWAGDCGDELGGVWGGTDGASGRASGFGRALGAQLSAWCGLPRHQDRCTERPGTERGVDTRRTAERPHSERAIVALACDEHHSPSVGACTHAAHQSGARVSSDAIEQPGPMLLQDNAQSRAARLGVERGGIAESPRGGAIEHRNAQRTNHRYRIGDGGERSSGQTRRRTGAQDGRRLVRDVARRSAVSASTDRAASGRSRLEFR